MLEKKSIGTSVLIIPEEKLTPGINIQVIPANNAALPLLLVSHSIYAVEEIKKTDKEYKIGELILKHISEIPHVLELILINQANNGGFEY